MLHLRQVARQLRRGLRRGRRAAGSRRRLRRRARYLCQSGDDRRRAVQARNEGRGGGACADAPDPTVAPELRGRVRTRRRSDGSHPRHHVHARGSPAASRGDFQIHREQAREERRTGGVVRHGGHAQDHQRGRLPRSVPSEIRGRVCRVHAGAQAVFQLRRRARQALRHGGAGRRPEAHGRRVTGRHVAADAQRERHDDRGERADHPRGRGGVEGASSHHGGSRLFHVAALHRASRVDVRRGGHDAEAAVEDGGGVPRGARVRAPDQDALLRRVCRRRRRGQG